MSSGGGSTQTTKTDSSPWSGQQPYLSDVFSKAQQNYNQGPYSFFPNATFVPASNQTEAALTGMEGAATDPNGLVSQAQGQLGKTLGGDYLSAGNPYFGAMMDRVANQIRPRLDAQFSAPGTYGGSAHQNAMASALADTAGQLAFQNYGQERGNQMQAMGMAPGMQNANYDILRGVGAAREGYAGQELGDKIARYNFNQQAPDDALRRYMTLVGGGTYGGTGTSSVQQKPSTMQQIMQGAGAGFSGLAGLQLLRGMF